MTTTTHHDLLPGEDLREGFREPATGELVLYENPTATGVERAWKDLNDVEDDAHWRRGALAHAVSANGTYGGDDLAALARETRSAYSTVRDYLATYRRARALTTVARATVLALPWPRYSHYRACNALKSDQDYVRLLEQADREKWPVSRLADVVADLLGEDRRDDLQDELPDMPPKPAPDDPDLARRHAVSGFLAYLRERHRIELAWWDEDRGRYRPPGRSLPSLLAEYFEED